MVFKYPLVLFIGLGVLAVIVFLKIRLIKNKPEPGIASSLNNLQEISKSVRAYIFRYLTFLRVISLALLIIALAHPIISHLDKQKYSEGIDIMLALDISSSMDVEDLSPNRLQAAIMSIKQFVEKRPYDRMGIILFGKDAFIQCPLTVDHHILNYFISELSENTLERNIRSRTAIGSSIMLALVALNADKTPYNNTSKIIILVTDGENTGGEIDPITATKLASTLDIKIYPIGIGKPDRAQDFITRNNRPIPLEAKMDEQTLKRIASSTWGRYFNALDDGDMESIFSEIDKIEKKRISGLVSLEGNDMYLLFIMLSMLVFGLEIFLKEMISKPILF